MKRSKMIEILRDAVQESNGDFGEYDLERAEFVLKILEEAGMGAPYSNEKDVMGGSIRQWDEENPKPKKKDPNACCDNEQRNFNGGCDNCGDPCL